MSVHVEDLRDRSRGEQFSWWTWRPIVELIGSLGLFDQRRLANASDGFGEFTADEARQIAAGLEERVLPRLHPDARVRLDGTATDEPDDGTFHRTADTMHLNYSVPYEDLVRFTELCKTADGLYVSQ
ncbi:MAG TPA: hypothetical protein VFS20_13270 [Longimicrobium sp.]|nr:hypothetical protein [Longimicrobium sp.]